MTVLRTSRFHAEDAEFGQAHAKRIGLFSAFNPSNIDVYRWFSVVKRNSRASPPAGKRTSNLPFNRFREYPRLGGDEAHMPDQSSLAKVVRRDPAVLPDALAVGAVTLDRMRQAGLLEAIGRALPLSRRGGYSSTALTAALITYMVSGARVGLRPFFEALDRMTRRRVAAVAGMRLIPTAASLSRGLGGLVHEAVRPAIRALLARPIDGLDIFQHPAVHHLDANGGAWHVLDVDPTVKAFRQRDLPEEDVLPPGQRRAPGQQGYTGRHRGELRIRAVPIIHDGTALWLGMQLLAEEGSVKDVASALVDDALRALQSHDVPADRVIVRGDGEFGSAGVMEGFVNRGVHFVTRIARYSLLKREQLHATLADAAWHRVRPSESGVPREACDLGYCTLIGTTEGKPQVRVRLVATRIPLRGDEARDPHDGHGIRIGSYRVELFATSLDPVAWPAADVAELYMGRSTIENRLAQEDRELALGRTFSMNPAGQEWAWGIGLFVWNEQICAGWRMKPLKPTRRKQQRRPETEEGGIACPASEAVAAESPLPLSTAAPPSAENLAPDAVTAPPTPQATDASISTESELAAAEPAAPSLPASADPSPTASGSVELSSTASADPAPITPGSVVSSPSVSALGDILARAYANLSGTGWRVDPHACVVVCPEGQCLKPYNLSAPTSSSPRLSVRTDAHACVGCSRRQGCYPIDRTGAYKQLTRSVPSEDVATCLAAIHAKRGAPVPRPPTRRPSQPHRADPRPDLPGPWYAPPCRSLPGPWWAERPQFVPSEARRRARSLSLHLVVRVELGDVVPIARPRADLAADRAGRAHRRRSYAEMEARNQLHPLTDVRLTVERGESRRSSAKDDV